MKDLTLILKKLFIFVIGLLFIGSFSINVPAENRPGTEQADLSGPESALQDAMDKLFDLIDSIENEKGLSEKEKTIKIFKNIKNVRWGPEKNNYFWIIDLNGNTVGEPVCGDLEGRSIISHNIIDYKGDSETKKAFVDLIEACNEKGQVFFQYVTPECQRDPADPKIALARLLVYKKWIIITGIYRDTIEAYQEPVAVDFFIPVDDPGPEQEIDDDSEPASGT